MAILARVFRGEFTDPRRPVIRFPSVTLAGDYVHKIFVFALHEGDDGLTVDSIAGPEAQWQTLRAKGLCYRGPRYVTGADLVRIARTLALEPWHFTQTAPAAANDPTGVVLDNARRRVNLRVANAAHGCVFHIRTLAGTGRCGLGELAPVSCRMFPSLPGGKSEGTDGSGHRLDEGELAEVERQWTADRDHWFELVARWNALAEKAETPPDEEDFHAICWRRRPRRARPVRPGPRT